MTTCHKGYSQTLLHLAELLSLQGKFVVPDARVFDRK